MSKNRKGKIIVVSGRAQVSRLETLLIYYEAFCRWLYASMLSEKKWHGTNELPDSGGVINFKALREYLLNSRPGDNYDYERFGIPPCKAFQGADHLSDPASALHGWCSSSRRVYHLSEDLQLLLSSTGFGKVTCGDIWLPFPSFAIVLDTPIREGSYEYDCILVSTCKRANRKWLLILAISKHLQEVAIPYDKLSRQLLQAVQSDNSQLYQDVNDRFLKLINESPDHHIRDFHIATDYHPDTLLNEIGPLTAKNDPKNAKIGSHFGISEEELPTAYSILDIALRIVLGIPLYFASLPNPEEVIINNGRVKIQHAIETHLKGQSAVVDGAHICTIKNIHSISPEERSVLRIVMDQNSTAGEKRTISPHFRTGYWRRPPGQGSDISAKKTVWVRPTLVNRCNLADGTLPEGSSNHLG